MMTPNYNFKVFNNGSYLNESGNLISIELNPHDLDEEWDFLKASEILEVRISINSLNFLKSLISKYDLLNFEMYFLNLGINLQNSFILYQDSYNDAILDDFKSEDREYKNLLNIIEEYLFNDNNVLHSISFNFNRKNFSTSPFKNKYILSDLMVAITKHLNITVKNFHERQRQILESNVQIKKGKGDEYIRTKFVRELFTFLKKQKPVSSNYSILKFIGCFLHIFQIPFYSTIQEIQIDSIEDEIKLIDVGLMRIYIDRPKVTTK